ncbi:MAG TPA: pantoate--beta-alanine ligase [Tepidisphaeraceae bacterium]|nr:pantoate--beta-alanine ligase [Tepidisphaeraceae bacterium]
MKVVPTIAECRAERAKLTGTVGFVPTMGALHAGHVSLIEQARRHADHVAVSVFVNPTQFGPREDFTKYPRPIMADLQACERAGVDLVFSPPPQEMYNADAPKIVVDLPELTSVLEGKHRPGHFVGVCQVVAKLFNVVRPDAACFGMKDYQQLRVIEAMVEALNFPIRVVRCPTLRDPDGMAMSSRNQYLSPQDRERGLSISRALLLAEGEVKAGVKQTNRLLASVTRTLLEKHLNIDYAAAVDPQTLKPVEVVTGPTVLAIAARVGNTRLIDNRIVSP